MAAAVARRSGTNHAGHAIRLEAPTVGVTGAAGDWGSANQWLLKINSGGGLAAERAEGKRLGTANGA